VLERGRACVGSSSPNRTRVRAVREIGDDGVVALTTSIVSAEAGDRARQRSATSSSSP
jgi:hypothetical protein